MSAGQGVEQETRKFEQGSVRIVPPEETLERVRPLLPAMGITRVANITGLDRIGIPVVAVVRPNARCYAVSQGKGISLSRAKASGVMEAIENWHAEQAVLPLRHARLRELRRTAAVADVSGLPRLNSSTFSESLPILWAEGARDLVSGERKLVPYELVHLDFRSPRPPGSGCFLMSSNGLSSGNHRLEAISHGLCEVIERDANTLWHLSGEREQARRRIDLDSVDEPACRALLERFDAAQVDVMAWNTTHDVEVASILCDVVDRRPDVDRPMPPVRGSGTHPNRAIALSRALTEAAQGRLTRISGSRDDLFNSAFDDAEARRRAAVARLLLQDQRPKLRFDSLPHAEHATVVEDVRWIGAALDAAGLREILVLDLTRPDLNVPVVRVIVPHLEATSEVPGYVPGARARRIMRAA